MTLFVLLLGLIIDRVWERAPALRSYSWFHAYAARLRHALGTAVVWDGPLGLLLVLLLPLLAVVLLHQAFAAMLGFLGMLFAVAVFVYALGPRDLERDVQQLLDAWEQGEDGRAWAAARELDNAIDLPPDRTLLGRAAVEGIVVAAHDRLFGVMFWFVVLGPAGALLFRLSWVLRERSRADEAGSGYAQAAAALYAVLAWLPSRLAALCYALVGSFADAAYRWRDVARRPDDDPSGSYRRVLIAAGLGALQLEDDGHVISPPQVRAALAMVWRTAILALVLIALVVVGGWLF